MTPEQQIRQLRTHSDAYGATDIKAQQNRVLALDLLYELAGRSNPDSTMHALYTGLWIAPPDTLP